MADERDSAPAQALTGKKVGPYRIEHLLGEGGMGSVFAATVRSPVHGLSRGDRVAVKTVQGHLLQDEDAVARFEREGKLGIAIEHPNVVRTYEVGTRRAGLRKIHMLVMEYVEGQTLAELLAQLGCVPEELCRHVGREMAKGLAAIHAEGVMHRDIKPSNVLITPDYVVKLMDLGVARTADDSGRISKTGTFVGSLAYAAPEQLLKDARELDGRIDAWATGVSLYELAAGVHPFTADTPERVVRLVVDADPERLGKIQPQVSPFFEEVVHALVAADRGERLGPAERLAAILDTAEESDWWREREQALRAQMQRPIRRVRIPRETAVYGREDELAALRSSYDKAVAAEGNLVLIEGEGGIGKTRLIDEFLAELEARDEDVNVLIGAYPPGGAATSARAFASAFREHYGDAELEETLRRHLAITPALVPAFAALLRGEMAPEGSEPLTKDSVLTVFVHALRSMAADRPTILWIDDLHLAPEEGRGLLAALAMALPGHRILLVATARPGLPADWLSVLDGMIQAQRVELTRLDAEHVERLLTDALGSVDLAAEIAPRITTKSDGNPFFAFEILKELRRQGVLRETEVGNWHRTGEFGEIEVPSTVLDMICARLAELTEDERSLVDVAACIGFEFDPLLVGDVLGLARIRLLTQLATVERRHRLVRSVGRSMVFDHHQLQEALDAELSELARESYHAAIAEALESREGVADTDPKEIDGALTVDLCGHFLAGAMGERAMRYLDAAIGHLASTYRYDPAVRLAERILGSEDLVAGAERIDLLQRTATWLEHLGRRRREGELLAEALTLAEGLEAREPAARVRSQLAVHLTARGRCDEALAMLEDPLERAAAGGDDALLAEATAARALAYFRSGRPEEARADFERAVALFAACGDKRRMAASTGNLAAVLWGLGRTVEARRLMERRLGIAREERDRKGEAIAAGNLGAALLQEGLHEEALPHLERYLEVSREIGFRAGEGMASGNLSGALRVTGRLADAHRWALRALEIARESGSRRSEAAGLLRLGSQLTFVGAGGEAREHLVSAVSLAREIGARRELGHALADLGGLLARQGEQESALETLAEAQSVGRAVRDASLVAESLVALGAVAADRGDVDAARGHFRAALEVPYGAGTAEQHALARAHLATLPGGDIEAALTALAEDEGRLTIAPGMRVCFLLFQSTGDESLLEGAHRRLLLLRDHTGEAYRDSIMENVPLHRAIAAAWDTRSAGQPASLTRRRGS